MQWEITLSEHRRIGRLFLLLLCVLPLFGCIACTRAPHETTNSEPAPASSAPAVGQAREIAVQIGERVFHAAPVQNAAADDLCALLAEGPLHIDMQDYGGFEKVGNLGSTLATDDKEVTAKAGDIVLYQGNQLVLFYGANTWQYTKIAEISDPTGLKQALGDGDVTVSFSLLPQSKQTTPWTSALHQDCCRR